MPGRGDGITKRADGRFMGRAVVDTPGGPKRKTVYGATYGDVKRKLNTLRADADRGLVFDVENLTVDAYLKGWLADSVKGSVKPVTYESYERLVRLHVVPTLGRVKLSKLTPPHVRKLYRSKLDAGLSPRTVQYLHVVLQKALKQAVRDSLIPRNVCEAVDPPQVHREEISPLTPEQVHTLLGASEAAGDRDRTLYTVAVHTGLRQGELLGLKWEDVDLEARTLQVRRTLSKGVFTPPKTAKSRRRIDLTAGSVAALRAHRKALLEERMERGSLWEDHGLVLFPSTVGTPRSRHNLTRSFKAALSRAGLPGSVRFHDLRHTCATLLLSRNVHAKYVQELLGHATIAITLDTYSHVLPGMNGGTASAMDDALG